jgi:type IV secretion system protein VirB1
MWIDQLPCVQAWINEHKDGLQATMNEVVRVESEFNPLALNVNGLPPEQQPKPQTAREAVRLAKLWIDRGYHVDIGIAQITDRNLPNLHTTIEQILGEDNHAVCANLEAGATILRENYGRAVQRYGEGQMALAAALSAYNTGNFIDGFENGYLAKYYSVPALQAVTVASAPARIVRATANRHAADIDVWR